MTEHLKDLLPQLEVRTLTHCYDDEDFEEYGLTRDEPERIFRVLWLGAVQHFDRKDIEEFFAALVDLLEEGVIDRHSFRARFVGPGGDMVSSWARDIGGEELVGLLEIVPLVPHEEAMKELKRATCLLYTQVQIGGRRRLPEFMASKKPILVFPSESERTMSDRVLRKYGAAKIIDRDKEQIKDVLSAWRREFNTTGGLELPLNEEIVQSFSASHVAAELDAVLQEVTK